MIALAAAAISVQFALWNRHLRRLEDPRNAPQDRSATTGL
jgi:hypothetical protein